MTRMMSKYIHVSYKCHWLIAFTLCGLTTAVVEHIYGMGYTV